MTMYCDCGWAMDGRVCSGCGLAPGECVCERRAKPTTRFALVAAMLMSACADKGGVEPPELEAPTTLVVPDATSCMQASDVDTLRKQLIGANYWMFRAQAELDSLRGATADVSALPTCAEIGCDYARAALCSAVGTCQCPGDPTITCTR